MSKLSYLNYLSNPAIVAACIAEEMGLETDEDRVTEFARYYEEPITVTISKCVCGWFDYVEAATCPQCLREIPDLINRVSQE